MPYYLKTVKNGAFKGCTNLRDVYVYSEVSAAANAFSGCTRLRCMVRTSGISVSGWGLPMDCEVYDRKMETGAGVLSYVEVDDGGNIYAITEDEITVLMSVAANCKSLSLPEDVVWVYEKALDDVNSDVIIEMPEELLFPMELAYAADWQMKDEQTQFTLAYNWMMSCMMCRDIADLRDMDMDTSRELVEAAMIRAEELARSYGSARPDGTNFSTILDECGVDWSYTSTYRSRFDTNEEDYETLVNNKLDVIIETYSAPEEDYENKYYTSFAAGFYYDAETGQLYLGCFAIMD